MNKMVNNVTKTLNSTSYNINQTNACIFNNSGTHSIIKQLKDSNEYPLLSKEEERKLIEKYKDTNVDKLRTLLFMHNIRIVFSIAKRYALSVRDFDALVSDCMYGLSVACHRFDFSRNVKFSTYAINWVFKYCLSEFYTKYSKLAKKMVSIDEIISNKCNFSDTNNTTADSYIDSHIDEDYKAVKSDITNNTITMNEVSDVCAKVLNFINSNRTNISTQDREIFKDCFYNHMTQDQLASKYNMTKYEITKAENRVRTKVRRMLESKMNISKLSDVLVG